MQDFLDFCRIVEFYAGFLVLDRRSSMPCGRIGATYFCLRYRLPVSKSTISGVCF